jgi:hypothetical protein
VHWTTRSFPELQVARLAIDESDERSWVRSHVDVANRIVETQTTEWHEWAEFTKDRTRQLVGTFRVKRFVH